jgi:hypothetical protein
VIEFWFEGYLQHTGDGSGGTNTIQLAIPLLGKSVTTGVPEMLYSEYELHAIHVFGQASAGFSIGMGPLFPEISGTSRLSETIISSALTSGGLMSSSDYADLMQSVGKGRVWTPADVPGSTPIGPSFTYSVANSNGQAQRLAAAGIIRIRRWQRRG